MKHMKRSERGLQLRFVANTVEEREVWAVMQSEFWRAAVAFDLLPLYAYTSFLELCAMDQFAAHL